MTLAGKVAIVTGGSRGIGRAVCLGLATHGAHVAFCHLDDPQADETRRLIDMRSRGFEVSAHVSREAAVE